MEGVSDLNHERKRREIEAQLEALLDTVDQRQLKASGDWQHFVEQLTLTWENYFPDQGIELYIENRQVRMRRKEREDSAENERADRKKRRRRGPKMRINFNQNGMNTYRKKWYEGNFAKAGEKVRDWVEERKEEKARRKLREENERAYRKKRRKASKESEKALERALEEAARRRDERDSGDLDDHFAEAPPEEATVDPKAQLLSGWARATGRPDPNAVKKQKGKTRGRLGKALLGLGAAAALGGGAYYGKNALWPADGSAAPSAAPAENSQNPAAPEQKEFPGSISGTVEVSYSRSENRITVTKLKGTLPPELNAFTFNVSVGFPKDVGGGEISAPVELIFINADGNPVVIYTFDVYSHRTRGASENVNFTATRK